MWLQLFEMTGLKIGWHRLQTAHALPFEATMRCSICEPGGDLSSEGGEVDRAAQRQKKNCWDHLGSGSNGQEMELNILKPSIWIITLSHIQITIDQGPGTLWERGKVVRCHQTTGRGGQRSWKGCTSSGSPMRRFFLHWASNKPSDNNTVSSSKIFCNSHQQMLRKETYIETTAWVNQENIWPETELWLLLCGTTWHRFLSVWWT